MTFDPGLLPEQTAALRDAILVRRRGITAADYSISR